MKLTLKNFRCYTSQTFEFDDDAMTLISGPSGRGKTTILLAIQFVLYGLSNHRYLISHNCTSCEVVLYYKNFKIKRTKRPNILNVWIDNVKYEDKEAQVILNKYFGLVNSSIFFMDLSHLEKMEFLEKIVNADCDVKELKNKIKNRLLQLNKELAILDGQILTTQNMFELIQKPEKVKKPLINEFFGENEPSSQEDLTLQKQSVIQQLEDLKIIHEKYNHYSTELTTIQCEIDGLQNLNLNVGDKIQQDLIELENLTIKNNTLNKLQSKILMVEETKKELKNYENIHEDQLDDLNQQLQIVNQKIETCLKHKKIQKLNNLKIQYSSTLLFEQKEWQRQKDLLTIEVNKIKFDNSKDLYNLEQDLQKIKHCKTFNLKFDKNDVLNQIEALKLNFFKNYNCPNCDHSFSINMDTFDLHTQVKNGGGGGDIQNIKLSLQKLEQIYSQIKDNEKWMINFDEDILIETINSIKNFNKLKLELMKYECFQPSKFLIQLQDNIESLSIDIPVPKSQSNMYNLDDLKDQKRDLTVKINKLSNQLMFKNNLLKKINTQDIYDKDEHLKIVQLIKDTNESLKLSYIESEKVKNFKRLKTKLNSINKNLTNLNFNPELKPQLQQLLEYIELGLAYHLNYQKYLSFQVELKKYKKVKETLKNFIDSKTSVEQTYLKTCILKQKVIESEHESLEGIVCTINTHLSILLQDFFSESFGDPIQIYLELTSEKRPQVNIIINYKGNVVDYKSLSTGEAARVKLAFDLTFKEILGEQIIMLDECTANLDQDLSTKIFNKIQGSFPATTILVVAHQVVMGTFDHLLQL
ncbi:DNA double-strand break repair rad50 ATPase-like [Invertebrate iridescent virus 30]|uniref:DNA double-strand break repair rad50 ATPase-like n=1 Tax=Invertebrate iridescent virus 30 TaxID=345585 RepID=W8W2K4_9VIRU|nr:DNA double-strand break repair rad50 ATPase-like [Invertebrate iridescent virus 30]CCV02360.1 DNA double-strand break repair rad50 ATPase-like [Invertebrate iridescent virus 30]